MGATGISIMACGMADRDDVDEGGLPGVLQSHERQLHLLLPEQRLEPF